MARVKHKLETRIKTTARLFHARKVSLHKQERNLIHPDQS